MRRELGDATRSGAKAVSSSPHPSPARPDGPRRGARPIDAVHDPRQPANPGPDTADDAEARRIVAAVLGGERDAFRCLVDRESRTVVRSCYRVLGDLHDAEDAAQEAFVTAYRALATWRGEGPFGAWISRIAVRIAIRKAARRRPVAWIDPRPPTAVGDEGPSIGERALASALGVETDDPAHLAVRAERAAAVRAAVAALEEPYREVVALRFFSDLSLAEIAAEADRPLGTVKTHLHRGLQRLRRTLEDGGAA